MIQALEQEPFFTSDERAKLNLLGLPAGTTEKEAREAFAELMLSVLINVSLADGATTPGEFAEIEDFIRRLEHDFELARQEDLEGVGTAMGMVPFIKGDWKLDKFRTAREILASTLERLGDSDAHHVRNELARAILKVAQASGGFMHMRSISDSEGHIIHEIVPVLKLDQCAEGLHLVGKTKY